MTNTKKIVAMLLVMVLLFSTAQQVVFAAEEETYTLPKIVVGERNFPAKEGYKLIEDMWVSETNNVEDDVEWVDDPSLLSIAKRLDPSSYADKYNPNVKYLNAYLTSSLGRPYELDDYASSGMERVFIPRQYENRTIPKPGDIAWEGNVRWSQGFVVHSVQGDKVVVYGFDFNKRYVVLRTNVDRFYYFYPKDGETVSPISILTDDNYALMLRRSRRPLMVGYNGYFYPDRLVTRAEFAQILVNLFELDPPKVTETSFSDVKPTDWFAPAVEAAKKAGLISGTPEGKFLPKDYVTYEHVAVVFANYWKQTGLYQKRHNPAIYLKDVGGEVLHARLQKSYAREEVEFSVTLGVLPGYSKDALYNYSDAVSRMEMAEMLYKIAGRHNLGKNSKYYKKENRPKFKDVDPQRSIPSGLAVPVLD